MQFFLSSTTRQHISPFFQSFSNLCEQSHPFRKSTDHLSLDKSRVEIETEASIDFSDTIIAHTKFKSQTRATSVGIHFQTIRFYCRTRSRRDESRAKGKLFVQTMRLTSRIVEEVGMSTTKGGSEMKLF